MAGRRRLTWGLAGFYAAYFGTVGVALPFWPVWLSWRGLDAVDIGVVLASGLWIKVLTNPLFAAMADRRGSGRRLMLVLPVVALLGYGGYAVLDGVLAFAAMAVVVSGSFPALVPIGESLALSSAETHGVDYGRVRLWGSVAFIAATVGVGHLLSEAETSWVLPVIVTCIALTWLACFALPDLPRRSEDAKRPIRFRSLLTGRFVLFLAVCGAVQASHVVYYGFGSIHWRDAGLSETTIGILWAEGVVAEIVLFLAGAWLTRRFGARGLLGIGGVAGVVRWSVLAHTTQLTHLVVIQLLHAGTFAAAHLGAMSWLRTEIPAELRTTATSLYMATIAGVAFGVTMPIAGYLYETVGGGAFLFGTGLAGLGALLAIGLSRN